MMLFEIIIKTKSWMRIYLEKEIVDFGFKSEFLDDEYLKVLINDEDKLELFIENSFYYSRSIEFIFLNILKFQNLEDLPEKIKLNFIKKKLSFEIDSHNKNRDLEEKKIGKIILNSNKNLFVNLKNPDISFKILKINNDHYIGLDLIGFDLSKRQYKINLNSNSINTLLVNYLFYLLEIDKEKKYSIIDISASLGDLIIESYFFNLRLPLNIKKKNIISFSKIFKTISMPKKNKSELKNISKYIAVVQNNKTFKELRENITYSSSKIKTSQYNLDFLDVKFKKGQIKYLVSNIPIFKDEIKKKDFLNEFFYQAEFIIKKKIGIISKKEIDEKIFKKYKLWAKIKKKVFVGEQNYFIYIILKSKN